MKTLITFLMLALAALPAHAQQPPGGLPGSTPETRAQAQELMTAVGAEKNMTQMLTLMRGQMVQMAQRNSPGLSPDTIGRTIDEVLMPEMTGRIHELRDLLAEIYAAQYTVDEMKGLQAFYETPLGKRLLELQPVIGQQSFAAGMAWGNQVRRDALAKTADELARRGVKL